MQCVRSSADPEADANLVDRLIDASSTKRYERVAVAGMGSLDVCVGLYRRGYDHAICRSTHLAPHTPEQLADVLWVLGLPNEADPIETLANLGRDLRPSGRLVIWLRKGLPLERICQLRRVLVDLGFLPIAVTKELLAGNSLICARKAATPPHAQVA